jgi:hypothetical protein
VQGEGAGRAHAEGGDTVVGSRRLQEGQDQRRARARGGPSSTAAGRHRRGEGRAGVGEMEGEGRGHRHRGMREGRGRLCANGKRKNKKLHGQQWWKGSPEKKTSPEPWTISPIHGDPEVGSTNWKHRDEALDETNAAVPSDSADDARIKSNCSPELETPQNFVERFRGFQIESEGGVLNFVVIYILLGFEDILFFIVIPFLKLKVIFIKRMKSFLISEKYLKGSKNSRKISRHDLAPNGLKEHS